MSQGPFGFPLPHPADRWRGRLSRVMLGLSLVLLAGTWFLISPPPGDPYPGAIPWSDSSLLRPLTDLMGLGGVLQTARGVEIKQVAFHIAVVIGLLILGVRALVSGLFPPDQRTAKGLWFIGQVALCGWVGLSAVSACWSGDPALSLGQAALFGLCLAWAISLSWTLESRHVPGLIQGYMIVAALGSCVTIWYYYERLPFHRPGFPIGNPSLLAAACLPALFAALFTLIGATAARLRDRQAIDVRRVVVALAALVPLTWCFWLAGSRGAMVGALVGVLGTAFLVAHRRVRVAVLFVVLAGSAAGIWLMSSSMQDVTMARGATIRFRLYTWQYAAELWWRRPISGMGAGSFPRLAGALSAQDRGLDPAAFMGDVISHAHNELFEVLAEIGLVGGVTFVAGFLATLSAASSLLQTSLSRERRWLLLGLLCGLVALMGDAMFGVALRLPGVPAVFYTLLGALWAMQRSVSRRRDLGRDSDAHRGMFLRRLVVAVAALVLACVGGWLALRNLSGLRAEMRAISTHTEGEHAAAIAHNRRAEQRLLDPVRILLARARRVRAGLQLARGAFDRWEQAHSRHAARTPPPPGDQEETQRLAQRAASLCEAQFTAARDFAVHAPNFDTAWASAAQCCEMRSILAARQSDLAPAQAAILANQWGVAALLAWKAQQTERPYDRETLMAMAGADPDGRFRYAIPLGERLGLLRDALRSGFADEVWLQTLRAAMHEPQFESVLEGLVRTAGPYTSETDLDALVRSGAAETYRLRAYWLDADGRHAEAAQDAARAVRLERPLRARFPTLLSTALAEQAEFTFRSDPSAPARPIELVRQAIDAYPRIQPQHYREQITPYRWNLLRYLLAADQSDDVAQALTALAPDDQAAQRDLFARACLNLSRVYDDPHWATEWLRRAVEADPGQIDAWIRLARLAGEQGRDAFEAVLQEAEQAGLGPEALAWIREQVCRELPELCAQPTSQP